MMVPASSLTVSRGGGHAVLDVQNASIPDFFTIENALFGGIEPEPATVSFRVEWDIGRRSDRMILDNPDQQFQFIFQQSVEPDAASIEWSAQNEGGFSFQSDLADTSINEYASVGHERNGVFYS